MKRIVLSLYIILSTLYLKAGEQYIYTKISNHNGLTSTVNCIYKEKDGVVWLGTPRGLYSFNGYNIKHFNDSLFIGRAVYDIEEDLKGGIWVLTSLGTLRNECHRHIGDRVPPLDHISDTGLPPYFEVYEMYLFNFNNNQLLLFPALLRVWYCLEGHDSLLAVCCMPEPTAGAGCLPVIGYTSGSFLYSYKLISRPHTLSRLGTD